MWLFGVSVGSESCARVGSVDREEREEVDDLGVRLKSVLLPVLVRLATFRWFGLLFGCLADEADDEVLAV